MNSFDVFDTLLARRFLSSKPIFNELATIFAIPDFAARRVAADNGTRSLHEIYAVLGLSRGHMEKELACEAEHAVPIQEMMDLVRHGDLLITDMYISGPDILRLVRHAGLSKQVTLYQSNRGKSSGSVWQSLAANRPQCHFGDNEHSDIRVPASLGFACSLYRGAQLTGWEAEFVKNGLGFLACLMREIRLRSNVLLYSEFFQVACQVNLPLLFAIAEIIRRRHSVPIVFLGRDTQLLHRIFDGYFAPAYYLPFSRKVAYRQPQEALGYIRSQSPADALLVDLSSTGATWSQLNGGLRIEAIIYSDQTHYSREKPVLPEGFSYIFKNSECGQTNQLIEVLNCADHGHLSRVRMLTEQIASCDFAPHELEPALVDAIHLPVLLALQLQSVYRALIRRELAGLTDAVLHALFGNLSQAVCSSNQLYSSLKDFFEQEVIYKGSLVPV